MLYLNNHSIMVDIVYVFKKWHNASIEMKYSLQFLSNFDHDNLYIIWEDPWFVKNFTHIPFTDWPDKRMNLMAMYKIICKDKRISDDFVLMNDDIYIINKIDSIWFYSNNTLEAHAESHLSRQPKGSYWLSLQKAYNDFKWGLSFETHCPAIFNKDKLLYTLEKYNNWPAMKSVYCNHYGIKWSELQFWEKTDCKIYNDSREPFDLDRPFVSSNDGIARSIYFFDLLEKALKKIPNELRYKYIKF